MSSRTVYTVSRINQEAHLLLERQFGMLWIEGELSNLSRPSSGHYYFSVKDSQSQLRCAMFKGRNRYLDFKPENGTQVLIRGKLGIYQARGDFQFIVEHMEPAGLGALQRKFDEIRKKLDNEGLFDDDRKRDIPEWPQTIGVITSPTGAAVQDILKVLERRYPVAKIVIYPTQVQGAAAVEPICRALSAAERRAEADVLLLARGGGSIEDLWAFNDERVARAIASCTIPLICGVGHETDVTIADMVADRRAPTPSVAAEMATPDGVLLGDTIDRLHRRLHRAMAGRLKPALALLGQLQSRLQAKHPKRVITERSQRVDELESRLVRAVTANLSARQSRLQQLQPRLNLSSPRVRIGELRQRLALHHSKMRHSIEQQHLQKKMLLQGLIRSLEGLSPLATLARGYAVLFHDTNIVTDPEQLKAGDVVTAEVAKGWVTATVQSCEPHKNVNRAPDLDPNPPC